MGNLTVQALREVKSIITWKNQQKKNHSYLYLFKYDDGPITPQPEAVNDLQMSNSDKIQLTSRN